MYWKNQLERDLQFLTNFGKDIGHGKGNIKRKEMDLDLHCSMKIANIPVQ